MGVSKYAKASRISDFYDKNFLYPDKMPWPPKSIRFYLLEECRKPYVFRGDEMFSYGF
jgi:hypothetical protein